MTGPPAMRGGGSWMYLARVKSCHIQTRDYLRKLWSNLWCFLPCPRSLLAVPSLGVVVFGSSLNKASACRAGVLNKFTWKNRQAKQEKKKQKQYCYMSG